MILGSVGVGPGIGMSDVCEGFNATTSECSVLSVSIIVVLAGSTWSMGVGVGVGSS